jgi:hypothetical protein
MTTSPDFAEHRTDQTAWCPATAQAVELVRALRHQLHEMTAQLAWVERQDVTPTNGSSHARCAWKQAARRRDIREAQVLIDRLQRRYLSGDERTQLRHYTFNQRDSAAGQVVMWFYAVASPGWPVRAAVRCRRS